MKCELSFMLQPSRPGAATVTRANVQSAEEYVAEVRRESVVYLMQFIL